MSTRASLGLGAQIHHAHAWANCTMVMIMFRALMTIISHADAMRGMQSPNPASPHPPAPGCNTAPGMRLHLHTAPCCCYSCARQVTGYSIEQYFHEALLQSPHRCGTQAVHRGGAQPAPARAAGTGSGRGGPLQLAVQTIMANRRRPMTHTGSSNGLCHKRARRDQVRLCWWGFASRGAGH